MKTTWRDLRRELAEKGARADVLDQIEEHVLAPTEHGGTTGRVVVARDEVVIDTLLDEELPNQAHYGALPHLAVAARALGANVRYAMVLADRTGADITLAESTTLEQTSHASEGDHDVLHKVRGGGWSHRRWESRVEDSWDRNAEQVAADLERLVVRERPDVVLLAGDDYARGRIRETAGHETTRRLHELQHGSRAPGADPRRVEGEATIVLDDWRRRRRERTLDRLRAGGGVSTLGEVVEALRRGEVEVLLLGDDALAGRRWWAGPEPTQLGLSADEVRALGVDDPIDDDAREVVVRAALGQGARLEPLPGPVTGLPEGVGAVLRFDTRPGRPTQTPPGFS